MYTAVIAEAHISLIMYFFADLKPPQIFMQCFENGTANFNWRLLPDQTANNLSFAYLKYSHTGWLISGNCTYQNNVLVSM